MIKQAIQNYGAGQSRLFKKYANTKGLVYFGHVNDHDEPLKGITLTTDRRDRHFAQGKIGNRDVTLLARDVKLSHPKHDDTNVNWMLCQTRLSYSQLPHVFIESHQHEEVFYENIFAAFANYRHYIPSLAGDEFNAAFRLYTPPDSAGIVEKLIQDPLTSQLLAQARIYDVEFFEDKIQVLTDNQLTSEAEFEHLTQTTSALADGLDAVIAHINGAAEN